MVGFLVLSTFLNKHRLFRSALTRVNFIDFSLFRGKILNEMVYKILQKTLWFDELYAIKIKQYEEEMDNEYFV